MTEVTYVLDNHLGGIASFCSNLANYRPKENDSQNAILLTNHLHSQPKIKSPLGADAEIKFEYSPQENLCTVLRRLRSVLNLRNGAIVSNSWVELELFGRYAPQQTVFQVVHDAYNLELAKNYEKVVDVFIAHSLYVYDQLVQALPHRAQNIFHLPYGIRLAAQTRVPNDGPIRLIFLGRLTREKGVLDLPLIDTQLANAGLAAQWTIIGDGPDRDELMRLLPPQHRVHYASPATNIEVLSLCSRGDMLVFPTRFEGFPVALLEAMSAGLVPVVSDLPSGIPEVVDERTGFRVALGNIEGFVSAILMADSSRTQLEAMSCAARDRACTFDVRRRAPAYHDLFARGAELKRPWGGPLPQKRGSRLDQPFLPNFAVIAARHTLNVLSQYSNRN